MGYEVYDGPLDRFEAFRAIASELVGRAEADPFRRVGYSDEISAVRSALESGDGSDLESAYRALEARFVEESRSARKSSRRVCRRCGKYCGGVKC